MKAFKKVDWILQLVLIVLGIALYFWYPITAFYLGVGGWQIVSVLIHLFFPAALKIRLRKVYLTLLVITVITGVVVGLLNENNLYGFSLLMLGWSPILAFLYLITCIIETNRMKAIVS